MAKTLGVIPARMASSRFPGKPLKKILEIPMLAHCYERALLSGACDKLIIATPDQEIIEWTQSEGIPSVLTSHSHQRATERAKEALDILAEKGCSYDFILLLQGDEPQIFPNDINNLKDIEINSNTSIEKIFDELSKSGGFESVNLSDGLDILTKMISDEK